MQIVSSMRFGLGGLEWNIYNKIVNCKRSTKKTSIMNLKILKY